MLKRCTPRDFVSFTVVGFRFVSSGVLPGPLFRSLLLWDFDLYGRRLISRHTNLPPPPRLEEEAWTKVERLRQARGEYPLRSPRYFTLLGLGQIER